ncbi:hypothetical protein Fmac_009471 [Flemingia macrophylla]|uniref:Uncharacterized protein n=1 Tax=Flemingia macrophylla TaxID=520843 RepID=A0ABD1N0C2_9FABA
MHKKESYSFQGLEIRQSPSIFNSIFKETLAIHHDLNLFSKSTTSQSLETHDSQFSNTYESPRFDLVKKEEKFSNPIPSPISCFIFNYNAFNSSIWSPFFIGETCDLRTNPLEGRGDDGITNAYQTYGKKISQQGIG